MTGLQMFGEVLAAAVSATSLTITGWLWFEGIFTKKEDELQSLYLFMGLPLLPLSFLFGMLAGAEAWVFVGVIWLVGLFFFSARLYLPPEED